MALDPLRNPVQRLEFLPDIMSWKGLWDANTQYFKGDVVECPLATTSYVLNVTADKGGATPSLNINWVELSDAATGVLSFQITGAGLTNLGTPTNVNLQNTGVTNITTGAGIATTGGSTPQLTNTGVISFNANVGLQNIGTATAVNLNNTGILSLTAGTGVTITGGQTPTISVSGAAPTISRFTNFGNVVGPLAPSTDPTPPGQSFVISFPSEAPPNKVAIDLLNGATTANALWRFNLSKFIFQLSGTKPNIPNDNCTIFFNDTTTVGGPFTYAPLDSQVSWISTPSASTPYYFTLGSPIIDVTAFRATGARAIDTISVYNNTLGSISLVSVGDAYCDLFPNGLS